ncbi:hypothetical protein L227DRAFT_438171 [Lentinus tigrinus ALCF2SS1-6]|uniref:REJ domain-containing protein n=1 Tax=Lentinus tigrinus ALCF2SS1-6 TaxID=1328759 RepID=A0A5C2SHV8_9APHY|nr:hypothetical protein L227DRAFT_438171 [Lentinus tigrinus ALCF2SS1-6]
MDAFCNGSGCSLVKRRRVYPRQTPSITVVATSFSGTESQPGTSAAAGATSGASSVATTSAPSAPTGRQDPSDAASDVSGSSQSDSNGSSANSDASGNASQPPSSNPPSSGQSSQPTSQPSSDPPSSNPPTSPPSSKPTSQPPSSDPTSPPTSDPPSSSPSSISSSSDPPSSASSDASASSSSESSSSSSPTASSSSPITSPTSLPTALVSNSTTQPPTSSGSFQTTITSAIATTVINGTTSTLFTTIPTTLSQNDNDNSSATKRDIIAGSVSGAAFIILVTALFLFYRRHQHKKLSFFKRLQPKPRTRLLDGEDMDDYDMGPPMARYTDYPASVASSHTHSRSATNANPSPTPGRSPLSRDFHDASPGPSIMGNPMDPHRAGTPSDLPPGAAAPHLMGVRAESGSIFREAVWPPPGQPSALVDPLVKASSAVDLSRIVDDVMGPSGSGSAAAGRVPPTAFRSGGGGHGSTASLIGDDPFASLSTLTVTDSPRHSQYGSGSTTAHSRETSDSPLLARFKPPSDSAPATHSTPGFFESRLRRDAPEPPGSPMPAGQIGPLFVTNMGPLSPTSTISHGHGAPGSPSETAVKQALGQAPSPVSPPTATAPRNWLERSPKKPMRPSLDDGGVDVTDVTSDGHGVGQAM